MPMNIDWTAIAAIPVLVLILFVVIYLWSRGIRRGKPLLPIQKSMITYACLFSLGMGYAIVFKSQLAALFGWRNAWIAVIVLLAVILAAFAWWRHRLTLAE
jgi:hypothetical protein